MLCDRPAQLNTPFGADDGLERVCRASSDGKGLTGGGRRALRVAAPALRRRTLGWKVSLYQRTFALVCRPQAKKQRLGKLGIFVRCSVIFMGSLVSCLMFPLSSCPSAELSWPPPPLAGGPVMPPRRWLQLPRAGPRSGSMVARRVAAAGGARLSRSSLQDPARGGLRRGPRRRRGWRCCWLQVS